MLFEYYLVRAINLLFSKMSWKFLEMLLVLFERFWKKKHMNLVQNCRNIIPIRRQCICEPIDNIFLGKLNATHEFDTWTTLLLNKTWPSLSYVCQACDTAPTWKLTVPVIILKQGSTHSSPVASLIK